MAVESNRLVYDDNRRAADQLLPLFAPDEGLAIPEWEPEVETPVVVPPVLKSFGRS
jgi:hypothetical protein